MQYLAIERAAEFKSEFFAGEMFAMAGASMPHNFIASNLVGELCARLKGDPCKPLFSEQRVKVDRTGLYTYPDILILCGAPEIDADDPHTLLNPTAIVEVLSPSTEKYDRGAKFRNYTQIPSLSEYILVEQDEALCDRYIRQADGSWALISFVGLAETLVLTSVSAQIPLADIYAGVAFPPLTSP